jgi:hypothetical protein
LVLRGYREEDRRAVARLAAGALDGSVEGWENHYDPDKNSRLDPEQVHVLEGTERFGRRPRSCR